MTTTMKGLLKGLRYITQIFDEEKEKEPEMQIGFPTDVKHVAHIGSDSPSVNTPSWMNDFKPQDQDDNRDVKSQSPKFNPEGKNQRGVGLQELLPPIHHTEKPEKPKSKTRRKSGAGSPNGSPTRRSSGPVAEGPPKPTRRHRSSHTSMDSSDSSVRRRRNVSVPDMESSYPLGDGSGPPRKPTSRHRRLKGSAGGELSMKNSKGKDENSNVQSVDTSNSSEKN